MQMKCDVTTIQQISLISGIIISDEDDRKLFSTLRPNDLVDLTDAELQTLQEKLLKVLDNAKVNGDGKIQVSDKIDLMCEKVRLKLNTSNPYPGMDIKIDTGLERGRNTIIEKHLNDEPVTNAYIRAVLEQCAKMSMLYKDNK